MNTAPSKIDMTALNKGLKKALKLPPEQPCCAEKRDEREKVNEKTEKDRREPDD